MGRSRRQWGSVRSLASGRYQARYLDPDASRIVPAPQTFATKREAGRWLAAKRTELNSVADGKAGNRPLREWWPGYWRSTQSLNPHTRLGYETAWRLRIEPRFGSMPVRRIKPSHVDDWVADMIEQGLSVSKITESLGVLKRVLDRAVRDRVIAANPCLLRAASLPKRLQMERPVLSPTEVDKLAQAMNRESDRVLVRLLAFGGLRINECFAMHWSDVDLERKTLTVRQSVADVNGRLIVGPTKTCATRTITLPDALRAQLLALKNSQSSVALVFPSRRGGYRRYGNWRRDVWDPACKASGINARPHDLRATCASLLIDAGASPGDVQGHLGQESVETTMRWYARVRPGRSEDLPARLNALIPEVEEGS
jgi:integrase